MSADAVRPAPARGLSRLRPKMPARLTTAFSYHGGSGRTSIGSPLESDGVVGVLRVQVLAARGLAAKDRNGRSDPYVVVRIGDQRVVSDVVRASLNPRWGDLPSGVSFNADGHSSKAVSIEVPVHHIERQRLEVRLLCAARSTDDQVTMCADHD